MTNLTPALSGTSIDNWYYGVSDLNQLTIDGFSVGKPVCFSVSAGNQEVEPGQRASAYVGYDTTRDPSQGDLIISVKENRAITIRNPT